MSEKQNMRARETAFHSFCFCVGGVGWGSFWLLQEEEERETRKKTRLEFLGAVRSHSSLILSLSPLLSLPLSLSISLFLSLRRGKCP